MIKDLDSQSCQTEGSCTEEGSSWKKDRKIEREQALITESNYIENEAQFVCQIIKVNE